MATAVDAATPASADVKQALKTQVEFYFSRANLASDAFLVSQMNSQMYVPLETVLGLAKIQSLTDDLQVLVEAIRDSKAVVLNEAQDAVKPNIKSERNTIILREVPSATEPEQVRAIFEGCGEIINVRSDVGDTWFVTMASEDEAVKTLLALRSKTFNNAPIKARLKSENILKSFYPTQAPEPVIAASGVAAGGAYARGYYASAPMDYYDMPNAYGSQYATGYNEVPRYTGGRGPMGRGQGPRGSHGRGHAHADAQHQPKEARAKSHSIDQRTGGRKGKDKKGRGQQQAATAGSVQTQAAPKSKTATAAPTERQPILSAANFPPLPAADKPQEAPHYEKVTRMYAHEDILEIVKNMDENDCKLPDGKMDFGAHPAVLTPIAHPDLLRNQRTYSIEQAREAMRQGRPIRSDSIGSIDYESMMYGEDYTNEVREQRRQKQEDVAASPAAAEVAPASAQPKVLGYAAAVINGTPASPKTIAAIEEKKKQVQTKTKGAAKTERPTKTERAADDKGKEKKSAKKSNKAETSETPAADKSLPTSGAWGGRNFLDVVKSEPAVPPPAPAAAAAPQSGKKPTDGKPRKDAKDKHNKERQDDKESKRAAEDKV